MGKSTHNVIIKSQKKMGRPVTTGKGELIGVRILPDLMTGLDDWIEAQDETPSRPEAIRQLLIESLKRKKLL